MTVGDLPGHHKKVLIMCKPLQSVSGSQPAVEFVSSSIA